MDVERALLLAPSLARPHVKYQIEPKKKFEVK